MKNITSFVVPDYCNHILNNLLNVTLTTNIVDYNKSWIAGGFPRYLFHTLKKVSLTNDTEKPVTILKCIEKYFESGGDIDIFSSDEKYITESINIINTFSLTDQSKKYNVNSYNSFFAKNYVFFPTIANSKLNKIINTRYKLQIIDKFIYKDIIECLYSFDIKNCRYALTFKNNEYIIIYDTDAEKLNDKNLLEISNFDNPFLPMRINKYLKRYNLDVYRNELFSKKIKQYLYQLFDNKWEIYSKLDQDLYHVNFNYFQENAIKLLHNSINIDKHDLILFLDMFDHSEQLSSSYGTNVSQYILTDWARSQINK